MPFRLIIAKSAVEKDMVYKLRHQVLVGQVKVGALSNDRFFDHFDCLDETFNVLALDNDTPVACLRVTLDNPVGLPVEEYFDYSPLRRQLDGKCCCYGLLCIIPDYRQHAGMLIGMFKLAIRKSRHAGHRHIFANVHSPLVPILVKVGGHAIGEAFQAKGSDIDMQPCHVDTDNFPPGAREIFVEQTDFILDDSDERRIYQQEEVIYKEGEYGDEAFIVMRGCVRVLPSEHGGSHTQDLLFGQGQLFGEVSLLDGGHRSTTIVAHSREVDLMVWKQSQFIDQIQGGRDKALRLCRLLASRLRRNIEGSMSAPSTSLLAEVLLSASQEGVLPVHPDWLSRQCAFWKKDFEEVVAQWVNKAWIAINPDNLIVVLSVPELTKASLQ